MGGVILGSPCKTASLQHKWGSHGPERLGGFPRATQPLEVAELVLTRVLNQLYHNLPPANTGPWASKFPKSKMTVLSHCYLSQGVVLIPEKQTSTKADVWDVHSPLTSSPHRFPDLGKNKPLSTNFIFQKNWMGVPITTIHPCFDLLHSVPSIQIWLRTSN